MAARGRKSAASKETKAAPLVRRPDPPSGTTERQAEEWNAVVDRMPSDWFTRETHALLAQYVRHVENAERLALVISAFPTEYIITEAGAERFNMLAKMSEREGRAMSSLATRLRLTQQSRYNPAAANTASKNAGTAVRKPWETE